MQIFVLFSFVVAVRNRKYGLLQIKLSEPVKLEVTINSIDNVSEDYYFNRIFCSLCRYVFVLE